MNGMKTRRSGHSRVQWSVLFALASLGQPPLAADAPQLMTGVELPLLEARVLSGESATLPRDAQGNASVLIIGFSKAATEISRAWLKGCRSAAAARPAGLGVHGYDVRMLEGVPRLFRSSVERGMRSGLPVDLQRQTLLVYEGNEVWRERLGVADKNTSYVIGCDKAGRVQGTAAGQFVEMELKKILEAITPIPPIRE